MNFKHKICPYCGKQLKLTAPSLEYMPRSVGRNNTGALFVTLSTEREFSYDLVPESDCSTIESGKSYYQSHDLTEGKHPGVRAMPIKQIENELKKGQVFRSVIYQCAECKNTVTVNRSVHIPKPLIRALSLFPVLIELASMLFAPAMPIIIIVTCLAVILLLLLTFSGKIITAYYDSASNNFVPVTELDDLVELPSLLTLSIKKARKKHMSKCNTVTCTIDGKEFSLYITEAGRDTVKVFICGTGDEAEQLVSIIEEKKKTVKQPILRLFFKGHSIGYAEVTEIHPISSDYTPPSTLVIPDDTVWYCKRCGYKNPRTAGRCASCDEWK